MCSCLDAQSCQTLCDPMDCSPPGSSVQGISQARTLERVAISFSRGSSWNWDRTHVSCRGRQILYHWATREVPGVRPLTLTLLHVQLFKKSPNCLRDWLYSFSFSTLISPYSQQNLFWKKFFLAILLLLLLSHCSRVRLCATPWMAAHQAPPSLGFSRQEHWSGLPFPSP